MAPRIVFALVVASVTLHAPALAESPQRTEIVPGAEPPEARSLYFTFGLGPPGEETERFGARSPTLAFAAGGSIPIRGKAYVDIGMFLSMAAYKDHAPAGAYWPEDDLYRTTLGLTVSARVGHVGRTVGFYGSAGVGLAYVRLAAPGGYGAYPDPVGSTMAPVLTVASSLETHPRGPSRFVTELRYSWIEANLGGDFDGPTNVGGFMLFFGRRFVF